ncbi:MAG: WbqC family protein [Alphaproteobacteria bacterium]|nr:WbqC family protein [Alphaproteobacteria bacterium]
MTVVAIHQPNFFPWLGYFDKIARSDVFVFLDHVAPPLGGSSRINRVEILINGKKAWLTVPIPRGREARQSIAALPLGVDTTWRAKIERTIAQTYARAPYAASVMPIVRDLLALPAPSLGYYNEQVIRSLCERLALTKAELVSSSALGIGALNATDLLIAIVKACGGGTYLSGDGADGYQDVASYAAQRIGLVFQEYRQPSYPRGGDDFVAGLSIIDALMHCGFEGTAGLIRAAAARRAGAALANG